MIIKLTPDEVKKYVAVALNLHSGAFDLEISAPESALLEAFQTAIREFPRHAADQKISAIKRFRDLAPKDKDGIYSCVGLADAKWAVENSALAILNLVATGNLH